MRQPWRNMNSGRLISNFGSALGVLFWNISYLIQVLSSLLHFKCAGTSSAPVPRTVNSGCEKNIKDNFPHFDGLFGISRSMCLEKRAFVSRIVNR